MSEQETSPTKPEEDLDVSRDSPLNGPGVAPDPAWFEQAANEPPYARHLLTTPLHLVAAEENRTNSWTEWSGYTVTAVYSSIEQEYDALRTRAGLSDISPLAKIRISGREACAYLDRLLTRSPAALEVNHTARAILCAGDGCIITEGMLFRLGAEEFRLVLRASNLDWLLQSAQGFDVQVEDVSGTIAGLSLAGPLAMRVLSAAKVDGSEKLETNQAVWAELGGMPVYVSRTGMVGGIEFEIWCDPDDGPVVWRRLMSVGREVGIRPVGAVVRDIARIENGVALEGVDYHSAFTAVGSEDALSPFDVCLGGCVDLDRSVFNGQSALKRIEKGGSTKALVGLELDVSEADLVGPVCLGDRQAGTITSHAWSPSRQRTLALALVDASALGSSEEFCVNMASADRVVAKLTKRPFIRFS